MRLFLYFIGKPREARFNALAAGYLDRCQHYGRCEMREIEPSRFDPWAKHPPAVKILLDPPGKALTSQQFAAVIGQAERESRDLVFVVGGADGFPAGWRERADWLLSLSPLTFPHELARVMLTEQIYRAFALLRGHPYPR